ncbi:hypothetical protein VNO77_02394 [Canavalia gladiata]|uniref:Uncharacterized protein n=1 Tax=Canavalia gladiata TaxID=3824 RepID=A0AAN9MTL8_CANGL
MVLLHQIEKCWFDFKIVGSNWWSHDTGAATCKIWDNVLSQCDSPVKLVSLHDEVVYRMIFAGPLQSQLLLLCFSNLCFSPVSSCYFFNFRQCKREITASAALLHRVSNAVVLALPACCEYQNTFFFQNFIHKMLNNLKDFSRFLLHFFGSVLFRVLGKGKLKAEQQIDINSGSQPMVKLSGLTGMSNKQHGYLSWYRGPLSHVPTGGLSFHKSLSLPILWIWSDHLPCLAHDNSGLLRLGRKSQLAKLWLHGMRARGSNPMSQIRPIHLDLAIFFLGHAHLLATGLCKSDQFTWTLPTFSLDMYEQDQAHLLATGLCK